MHRLVRAGVTAGAAIAAFASLAALAANPAAAMGNCTAPPAPGVDYSSCDLSGQSFVGADLTGADLTLTNLTGADLTLTNLTGADLTNATVTNASMFSTNLTDATLTGIISGGVINSASTLPSFWQLDNGYLVGPGAGFLSFAHLAQANMAIAHLVGANLEQADLRGAAINLGDLRQADFQYADLEGANIFGAFVADAQFAGANLNGIGSGQLSGTPASLPPNWLLIQRYLVGDGVDLTGTTLIPPSQTVAATGKKVRVTWPSPAPGVFCDRESNSRFFVGATTVHCALPTGPDTGAIGSFVITVIAPPKITQQPKPVKAAANAFVSFTATATAFDSPTVQWQVSTDGVNYVDLTNGVQGANTTTLTIHVTSTLNGDLYRAVFTNFAGSTVTHAAKLTVH